MELALEHAARDAIVARVRKEKWTLAECVERLGAVGYPTSPSAVNRLLTVPNRRLGLDEFGAWALALSLPPVVLLAAGKKRRQAMIRGWFKGTAPLPEVPDPARYEQAARDDRPVSEPELVAELRRQADRYASARGNERAQIEVELLHYLTEKQLADFKRGQARARERHPQPDHALDQL